MPMNAQPATRNPELGTRNGARSVVVVPGNGRALIWNLSANHSTLAPMKTPRSRLRRLSRSAAGMVCLGSALAACSSAEMTPDPEPSRSVSLMPELDAVRRERLADISGRFLTPEGFQVEMAAAHDLVGSVVNMTFGPNGRPVLALLHNGIVFLEDRDRDGQFERKIVFTSEIETAHGLEFVGPGDLLTHALGPEGTGLYRVRDLDGDDRSDRIELITPTIGELGEHGPHEIALGPDGALYVLFGNHSYPDGPVHPLSPSRNLQEDHLLPRFLDPRGHARNIRAPGGTIHRFDLESGEWSQIAGGFRNPFDFAIDLSGEIFTFEADMEWDLGLPWYRPNRVLHVIPGGDYGWRTGSSKFQPYYIDTLPSVDDVGRGSPVGVEFYYHDAYPENYRGAFFMGDWSRGRIRVIFPSPKGASYEGTTVDFVHGEPLNVSDLEVGPDGFLYFCTGGRETTGGLFRVRYEGDGPPPPETDLERVLRQPMPRSAWGQAELKRLKASMGEHWVSSLREAVLAEARAVDERRRALEILQIHGPSPDLSLLVKLTRSDAAEIRSAAILLIGTFSSPVAETIMTASLQDEDPGVVRRAAEGLVRQGQEREAPLEGGESLISGLFSCLESEDRFARYSCRQALEGAPKSDWLPVVEHRNPNADPGAALEALLAWVHRLETEEEAERLFEKFKQIRVTRLGTEPLLGYLRVLQLALLRDPRPVPGLGVAPALGRRLILEFPHEDRRVNRELLTMLSFLEVPGVVEKGLAHLASGLSSEEQIHAVYALRTVETGWTPETRGTLIAWFRKAWHFRGAASMEGFLGNLWESSVQLLEPAEQERAELLKDEVMAEKMRRLAAYLADDDASEVERGSRSGDRLSNLSFEELSDYLEYDPTSYEEGDVERGRRVFYLAKCVNCHVFGEEGRGGGPDLSTVVNRFRRREILESIMFPSRVVSDQYVSWSVRLKNHDEIAGMFVAESDNELTLITATGERVDVAKDQIEERRESSMSIMPERLIDSMTLHDLVSLMVFLEEAGID